MSVKQPLILLLLTILVCLGQEKNPAKVVLKVDEDVSGPLGGQRSASCLRVYSDGRVLHARWWNAAMAELDKNGKEVKGEQTLAVEHVLASWEVWELSNFLESSALKDLPDKFPPPHRPVDYFESVVLQFTGANGTKRRISTREFHVASLEEKASYPSALLVLMNRIGEIERDANENGKSTQVPADCRLKSWPH